jgi:uncharacterized protein
MARPPHFLTPLLAKAADGLQLVAAGRPEPIATRVIGAFDSASRKRGLLGRSSLPQGEALVIAPCNAVHTFRMKFAIDLVYAARDGRVMKLRHSVAPNRMSAAWGAFAVIELPAATITQTGLDLGDRLELRPAPIRDPPEPARTI